MPDSVVRRLSRYLMMVQRLSQQGAEWVSSLELAEALGLTSSTVRQDLSHLDFSGISKRGYSTTGLAASLARALGADREIPVVVVGAGNLGRALAQHEEFGRQGFKICGIFDRDARLVGERVGAHTVREIKDLPAVMSSGGVEIGIIAVPPGAAQEVADRLIMAGVRGLLNMTTAHILVPGKVSVVDARIVACLQELTYAIKTVGMVG